MAKRGYKLHEFVAHSATVNCVSFGKKYCRHFVSGGDDCIVHLWSLGKSTSLASFCGHTSPVESLAFDSGEVSVLAGASTGEIKYWDLQQVNMIRSFNGHRSCCAAVDFHPFGEFFASGSMDTNLKIWDIRKKGSIHTYKGHTRGISTVKFSPDGRWVVSGGHDNVVKVWDLTAGKLLNEFKSHDSHIRSIDFHPIEYILATGSADRTVKFWDLETFELIGSSRPEATGLHAIIFQPDGRSLFCGLDNSLKVYSWEPVICHETVDMGWSNLGDLCIHQGKLLGCSYLQNSLGLWIADLSVIEPYGAGSEPTRNVKLEKKIDCHESNLNKSGFNFSLRMRSASPDYEIKAIKNIYIDSAGCKTVASSPKVVLPLDPKNTSNLSTQRLGVSAERRGRHIKKVVDKSNALPTIVPHRNPNQKDLGISRRESVTAMIDSVRLPKPPHNRSPSIDICYYERMSESDECDTVKSISNDSDGQLEPDFYARLESKDDYRESCEDKPSSIKSVAEKFEKISSPLTPLNWEKCNRSQDSIKERSSVKFVDGAAVLRGRTRSLVKWFERGEILNIDEDETATTFHDKIDVTNEASSMIPETEKAPNIVVETYEASTMKPETDEKSSIASVIDEKSHMVLESDQTYAIQTEQPQISGKEFTHSNDGKMTEYLLHTHDVFLNSLQSRLTKLQVIRKFWVLNDFKGAINAMKKLHDHSVQADVLSVFLEKIEILTLDLFSCLLPVLVGLLDSKAERHVKISLELLLKLVAVFGPVIHSSISAPPLVVVDLHAEQRLDCCNQCFNQLQKIQKMLQILVRRGGLLAKSSQELNLVLQHL